MSEGRWIWQDRYDHPGGWDQQFEPLTLPELLAASARKRGKAPLLDFLGRRFSYEAVWSDSRRFAEGLVADGIEPGDRIGLLLPNVPQYLPAYYGALMAGAVVVNFSPLCSLEETIWQAGDSGVGLMVTLSRRPLLERAMTLLEKGAVGKLVVARLADALKKRHALADRLLHWSEEMSLPRDSRVVSFGRVLASAPGTALPHVRPDDLALLQYTGGTTGRPKGAMLTHQNLSANARQLNSIDSYRTQPDRIIGVLPFFHVYANTGQLNRTVANGGMIALLPRFDARKLLKTIERVGATSIIGVPTLYRALLDSPQLVHTDMSTLRVCTSGGAALPQGVRNLFSRMSEAKIAEGYGLTESAGVISANPYSLPGKPGSIGQPLPGTEVRILDCDNPERQVAAGEVGEIAIAGPQVMQGYWNRPQETAAQFTDGYFRTGDVGRIDADGYLHLVDRIKDMFTVGGFNIYPGQIEDILHRHPAVRDAIVIGVPDEYWGEVPKAFVQIHRDRENPPSQEQLRGWLNERLGRYQRVAELVIRDDLPRTAVGKLSRRDLVAQEQLAGEAPGKT